MTDDRRHIRLDQPMVYRIRVQGELGDDWGDWFREGGCVSAAAIAVESGVSILTCTVRDQPMLYSLLTEIRNLGLPLLSLQYVRPGSGEEAGRCDERRGAGGTGECSRGDRCTR